jgi:DNA-binding LacI/PurR family transcriptional regulator
MSNIKDVAARAGVSKSTVHYALNGKRPISETVRQRVMAAVTELDYTASTLAQRMREGRSYSIGMIAPQLPTWDASTMEMLISTTVTASGADHTLGIFMQQTPEQVLQLLRNQLVDGLILIETTHNDPRIEALRNTKYPFVLIGRTQNLEGLTSVDFDFEEAVFLALENLVQLGHRRIGFIAPHQTEIENWYYIQRGFERARATYTFEPTCVFEGARLNVEDGFRVTEKLLETEPRITAIFAAGHSHVGVMRALYSRNIRVPDDCSVIGITTAQVAEWTIPKLTSVDIPLFDMSQTATRLLLRKLGGEQISEQILVEAKLVSRESTAAPKKRVTKQALGSAREKVLNT